MVIVQAVIAVALRSLGRIANMALGWATVMLFGRVPQERQLYLSGIAFLSVIWMIVVVGVAFPSVGTFLLTFVTLPRWISHEIVRLAMLGAAVVLPPVVGAASLLLTPPASRPRGAARAAALFRGYRYTVGIAIALLMLSVIAPGIQVWNTLRRRTTRHVPVIVHGPDYAEVVDNVQRALAAGGIPTTPRPVSRLLRLPSKILAVIAGEATGRLVARQLTQLTSDTVDVLVYPFDLMIGGPAQEVAHAQAMLAEHLTFTKAYLTWSDDANRVEDRLRALWLDLRHRPDEPTARRCRERLRTLERELQVMKIPYEEWEVLFRGKLLLERQLCCQPVSEGVTMAQRPRGSPDGGHETDAAWATGGYRSRTEDAAARLRQSLSELLAVAQDYANRRMRQAQATVRTAVREILLGAAMLIAAAAIGGLAVGLALAAGVLALALVVPAWAAALIACGVLLLTAVILGIMGMRRIRTRRLAALRQTLREDLARVRDAIFAPVGNGAGPRPRTVSDPERSQPRTPG